MNQAFVLFEAMNHANLVLKEAKARGLTVVVLNHVRPDGPGLYHVPDDAIDEFRYVESWEDGDAVQVIVDDVAARYEVVGTYGVFEGALPYEAALRERAGLPTTSEASVRAVLDKAAVRRKLYAHGLSELRSVTLDEALGWDDWQFARSAVLKPVNGTGSALCYVVSSLEELRAAAERAEEASVVNPLMREYIVSRGEFVLEERAEGELLSVESLVDRGQVHVVGLTARYLLASDPVVEQGVLFPYQHPRMAEIAAKVKAIHEVLDIRHGATHVEVMVPVDGPIELIDFNPRMAGIDCLVCMDEAFGLPYESRLVDLACGIEPDLAFLDRPPRSSVEAMTLPPPGTEELTDLVFPPEVVFGRLTKAIGEKLSGNADQLDCVAFFVVTADTPLEAHRLSLETRYRIVVNGRPVGRHPNNDVTFPMFIGDEAPAAAISKESR